ncbi:MAG: N-acetylglucosamine 6-phosphate deacetylase [Acidobacteriaceae bacterium]|nr:N-acetylglucosamine 6-phosphate deacetylase [Acidobacteriaceae bacterium]
MIALTAARLYTPIDKIERPLVLIENGQIVEVTTQLEREIPRHAELKDFGDSVLAPGFIDLHIHGGAGHDLMESDPAGLPAVQQSLAKHGVTSYFPTTVTAPLDQTLSALDRLATAIEASERQQSPSPRQAIPCGIHLEGPFLSHKRRGVHPAENLLAPTMKAFDQFWQASRGHIRIMTIAPELEGALEVIAESAKRGVCISLGHSDATLAEARSGVAAGGRHATHTFNAMRPLSHRDPGILAEVLTNPKLSADIIVDGFHLEPSIVKLFLKAKGPENTVLITDGLSATGMPEGNYQLGSLKVEVKDGKCLFNGVIAGSVLTMDLAVRNVMKFGDWDLQHAVRAATLNPARVSGLANTGKLQAGAEADLVVLSPSGEVRNTIVRGCVNSGC